MRVEIPGTDAVRRWLYERAEVPVGRARPADSAHVASFDGIVAVAGRDHAFRSPEEAIREGAELILAGLLLEEHRESVLDEVADAQERAAAFVTVAKAAIDALAEGDVARAREVLRAEYEATL